MTDHDFLAAYINSFRFHFANDIAGVKNLESRYLIVTDKYAQLLGFKNASELHGLGDGDALVSTAQFEKVFYQQDRIVEQSGTTLICLDNHFYSNGFDSYVFHKTPVINPRTRNILGVRLIASKPLLLSPIRLAIDIPQVCKVNPQLVTVSYSAVSNFRLTSRQHLVLFLILNGYSQGEIVQIFPLLQEHISEPAVKDILRVLKIKLGVNTKKELINKATRNGLHTCVPVQLMRQGSFVLHDHEFKIK